MTLSLSQTFVPNYPTLPSYLSRSSTVYSPRFPRDGTTAGLGGQTIGTDGVTANYLPVRSDLEAARWGATAALWCYTDLADTLGFANSAEFVNFFLASGVPLQGAGNFRSISSVSGPFAQDSSGDDFVVGNGPNRPALVSGTQSPVISRPNSNLDWMPAADQVNSYTPKMSTIVGQVNLGLIGIQMDSPSGLAALMGNLGINTNYDTIGPGADFSATSQAGFAAWLLENTSEEERDAVGLTGWTASDSILDWMIANKPTYMFANPPSLQVDPTDVDNYIFRTTMKNDTALRKIIMGWMGRFLRDDRDEFLGMVRDGIGANSLFSPNVFAASPAESTTGCVRANPGLWDFAMAETSPPYPSEWGGAAVNSASWYTARFMQQARQQMYARAMDMCGLRVFHEHKPAAPNSTAARVVKQLLRQSCFQSIKDGHSPTAPVDVYLNSSDSQDQGTTNPAYRFWGSPDDYGDVFEFIRDNSSWIDDYEICSTVHVAVHSDSFPDQFSSTVTYFNTLMERLRELWIRDVDYHFMIVGLTDGLIPADPVRSVETTTPLIIRLQNDGDYYAHLGRLCAPNCRKWANKVADEACGYSAVRSTNEYVRASARYNAAERKVSIHLVNYAIDVDGNVLPQTTTVLWNWDNPIGNATVHRIGEADLDLPFVRNTLTVPLNEYAIINFSV